MVGDYARQAAARLGQPVEAAGVFRRYATPMVGSSRLFSAVTGAMSRATTRFGAGELPKRFVLAVTEGSVHVLPVSKVGLGGEVAAWDRPTLKVLVEASKRGMEVLIQPPGDRPPFECLGADDARTRQVVAALTGAGPLG